MKILYVAARLPYPPLKGDQVRGYHQLRLLSQKHQITLISFVNGDLIEEERHQLSEFCDKIITLPLKKFEMARRCLQGAFAEYPFQTLIYQSAQMAQLIKAELVTNEFDLIHVQLARMAPYFQNEHRIPCVIDLIDALSINMERRFRQEHSPMKLATYIEWQRLRAYERVICQQFDCATIVSASDRQAIGEFPNLYINANGVDLNKFYFVDIQRRNPTKLIFNGNMGYFPNINAVKWFAEKVFPLIKAQMPDVHFEIVGVNPHQDVMQLATQNTAITVTGYVEDMHAYLAQASIAVVPMQAGSGMQSKVIEAMACGTPVVATSFALAGIDAIPGEHLLIADTQTNFAEQVIRLLKDVAQREYLARNGRLLVEQKYTWEQSVADLEQVYMLAISKNSKNV